MPLTVQKVDAGSWVVCAPKHTAGELDTLPFRAAIWDPLAVYGWLSGPPTYNVNDLRYRVRNRGQTPRSLLACKFDQTHLGVIKGPRNHGGSPSHTRAGGAVPAPA